jgi:hypothetical protein
MFVLVPRIRLVTCGHHHRQRMTSTMVALLKVQEIRFRTIHQTGYRLLVSCSSPRTNPLRSIVQHRAIFLLPKALNFQTPVDFAIEYHFHAHPYFYPRTLQVLLSTVQRLGSLLVLLLAWLRIILQGLCSPNRLDGCGDHNRESLDTKQIAFHLTLLNERVLLMNKNVCPPRLPMTVSLGRPMILVCTKSCAGALCRVQESLQRCLTPFQIL